MKRLPIVALCLAIGLSVSYGVYRTSVPRLLPSISGSFALPDAGDGDSWQIVGYFSAMRPIRRQWFRNSEVISRAAFLAPESPGMSIEGGWKFSPDHATLTIAPILTVGDSSSSIMVEHKPASLEFNYRTQRVTLLETAQMMPFSEGRVYVVFIGKDLKPERFVALGASDKLSGIGQEAAEAIESLFNAPRRLAEPDGAHQPATRPTSEGR